MNARQRKLEGKLRFFPFLPDGMARSTHYLPKFLTLLHLKNRDRQITLCFRNDIITGTAFAYYIVDSLLITGVLTYPMASQVPDQLRGMGDKKRKKQNGQ
jgi:hypothetical protein